MGKVGLPREDVLRVVVSQIDRGRPSDRDALWFALVVEEQIRRCSLELDTPVFFSPLQKLTHRLLHPHRLTPRPLRHALDVREEPLALLGHVPGREHVPLGRHPQQALDDDLAVRQRPVLLPEPVLRRVLSDPPPAAQDLALVPLRVLALQRRHHRVPLLPVHHPRAYQHLLIMPQPAPRPHPAVVKVRDRRGIDAQRELERRKREAVLEAGHELRLPAQAPHLPAAQRERGDGDGGEDEQPGAVLLPDARHLGGAVEDRDEGRVEPRVRVRAGPAAHGAPQDEQVGAEALAEALRGGRGAGARRGGVLGHVLGVVPTEEVQERIRFRHGGYGGEGSKERVVASLGVRKSIDANQVGPACSLAAGAMMNRAPSSICTYLRCTLDLRGEEHAGTRNLRGRKPLSEFRNGRRCSAERVRDATQFGPGSRASRGAAG